MSRSLKDQTLALAGVFQAANLVQQIAHNGQCNEASLTGDISYPAQSSWLAIGSFKDDNGDYALPMELREIALYA